MIGSEVFHKALGRTIEAMQAASSPQAAYDILSSALQNFGLQTIILNLAPDRTMVIEHASFSSSLRQISRNITGLAVETYVGHADRIAALQEILASRRTMFIEDLNTAFAEGLGFAGAKPIAGRLRSALGIQAMITAPLISGDDITGLLAVAGSDSLTPEYVPYVALLAAQVSARRQAQPPHNSPESTADTLHLITQINREVFAFPDLEEVLHRALRRLHEAIPAEYAFVALTEGEHIQVRIESYKSENYQPPSEQMRRRPLRVGTDGIIGHVAGSGQPILANDVRQAPHYIEDPNLPDVLSELAVPLRYRDEIVGVLDVEATTLNAFDQSHVDLLEAASWQLAAAIAIARLRNDADSLQRQFAALATTPEILASTLPLSEALTRILQQARHALGAHGAALHLLDEQEDSAAALTEVAALDTSDRSAMIADLAREVALSSGREGKLIEVDNNQYLLSAPLHLGSRSLGAITLVGPAGRVFTLEDRRSLSLFAHQAATAISLTRLQEQSDRRRQFAETLNLVSRVVGSSLELDQVLDAVLSALREIIPFTSASIMLFEGSHLSIAQSRSVTEDELEALKDVDWTRLPTMRAVIAQRRPLVISDTADHEVWKSIEGTNYIKSWIGVPLISRGNIIGILNVNSDRRGQYQTGEGNTLMAFANQIATALDNALLLSQSDKRQLEARALYEATRLMVSSAGVDEMVQQVLASLQQIIPYDVGVLLRVIDQTPEEPYHVEVHTPQPVSDDLLALARQQIIQDYETLSGNLASRRDVTSDTRLGENDTPEMDALPARLSVPLLHGDHLVGLIDLNSTTGGAYDESHLRTLFTIANPLVTALQNAYLVDALRARAEQLEEVDRTRDEVVQNISHDLRNPLTFIRGYIQLLLDRELGPLSEQQALSLEVVSNKTDTLIRLVSDIITLSTLTPDMLTCEPVNLAELVEQAVKAMRPSAKKQGLKVKAELPREPTLIMADPHRINQVIDNLLMNALKFSQSGGTIAVRVINQEAHVRVEVEDEGIGIPLEQQEHIFDRFFRGDHTHADEHQGTGLGLAISKQIVEAHRGIIGVESEPGRGSTFYFELQQYEA